MKDNNLAKHFIQDLDSILKGEQLYKTGDTTPEYEQVLQLASVLKDTDFSSESKTREGLRRRLMNRCLNNHRSNKEVIMNKLWVGRRPALILGTAAVIAMFGFALMSPGKMMAMANEVADNISKILRLSNNMAVVQMESKTPQNAELDREEREGLRKEGVSIQTSSGEVIVTSKEAVTGADVVEITSKDVGINDEDQMLPGTVSYASLAEAQEAVCFKILTPEILPLGYSFKEAQGYQGSDQYINLYFSGPGKDIILMQRIMNQNTSFVLATDGPVDPQSFL